MKYFIILIILFLPFSSHAKCSGDLVNPISDVCWSCIFPIDIGTIEVSNVNNAQDLASQATDVVQDVEELDVNPFCICPKADFPIPGIKLGFWEPHLLADVTGNPYCLVGLGGEEIIHTARNRGGHAKTSESDHDAFYHVHFYHFPILSQMNAFADLICLDKPDIDMLYISEIDPTWDSSTLAAFLHPEALLFGNLAAQSVCVADCAAASTLKPINKLFWCGGCQGGTYPMSGRILNHKGGVSSSIKSIQKAVSKLHRIGIMWDTSSEATLCGKLPMPFVKKTQYRFQMTYPVATVGSRAKAANFGEFDGIWSSMKSFPVTGEDFGYIVWRRRKCCAL